ncbi:hypothetical protein [Streptomyces sp. NPDC093225]|uniref:hypothetical protein n=1 Tax=Streptomyces sp. NPDC093225 TaxID=3366034 RepID=UPI0038217B38
MSALPHESPTRPWADPYRLAAAEGPQTIADLRAALAVVSPPDLVAFDARLGAARLDEVPLVLTEYRHVWALRTRPEVADAIGAALEGSEKTGGLDEFFARFDDTYADTYADAYGDTYGDDSGDAREGGR